MIRRSSRCVAGRSHGIDDQLRGSQRRRAAARRRHPLHGDRREHRRLAGDGRSSCTVPADLALRVDRARGRRCLRCRDAHDHLDAARPARARGAVRWKCTSSARSQPPSPTGRTCASGRRSIRSQSGPFTTPDVLLHGGVAPRLRGDAEDGCRHQRRRRRDRATPPLHHRRAQRGDARRHRRGGQRRRRREPDERRAARRRRVRRRHAHDHLDDPARRPPKSAREVHFTPRSCSPRRRHARSPTRRRSSAGTAARVPSCRTTRRRPTRTIPPA